MYMLNMVIILIVMYCNVVTAIDKIPTYLLRFNSMFSMCALKLLKSSHLNLGCCATFVREVACASDFVSMPEKYVTIYMAVLKLAKGAKDTAAGVDISCIASLLTGGGVSTDSESRMRSNLSSFFGFHDGRRVYLLNTPNLLIAVCRV